MEYCCQFLFCFGDCIWGSGRLFAYESARSCVEYFYRDTEDKENMLRRVSGTQALRQCLCPTVCRISVDETHRNLAQFVRDSAGASYLSVPLCLGHTISQKPTQLSQDGPVGHIDIEEGKRPGLSWSGGAWTPALEALWRGVKRQDPDTVLYDIASTLKFCSQDKPA